MGFCMRVFSNCTFFDNSSGRLPSAARVSSHRKFQPTPTHGGRLTRDHILTTDAKVSTHAHARWATLLSFFLTAPLPVSTHAHARWATRCTDRGFGRDSVSTHAHARWATPAASIRRAAGRGFNPRPRTVGDSLSCPDHPPEAMFQPTPTHGGRPPGTSLYNSRYKVSTHAHARWATSHGENLGTLEAVSTHAHARWATQPRVYDEPQEEVSTHAHARWATFIIRKDCGALDRFQPTPTHGGRLVVKGTTYLPVRVSTHAHARWAT